MTSRLFHKLREESLIYDFYTWSQAFRDSGFLKFYGAMSFQKGASTIKIILETLNCLRKGQISEQELDFVKNYLRGSQEIRLEDNTELAIWLGELALLTDKVFDPETYLELLNEVTIHDIQEISNQLFIPNNIVISVVYPAEYRPADRLRSVFLEKKAELLD